MSRGWSFGADEPADDLIQLRRGAIQPTAHARASYATDRDREGQDDRYCEEDPEQHEVSPRTRSGVPP
jgi:hypothetical protein